MSQSSKDLGDADILVRAERLRLTGVWYRPAWWRETTAYQTDEFCSKSESDAAFDTLAKVFSPKWFKSKDATNHSVASSLYTTGEGPFSNLLEIGLALVRVKKHGVLGKLEARLKKPQEFEGAQWELLTQEQLIRHGCSIRAWPIGGARLKKNFEFVCKYCRQGINVEIKHVKLETVLKRASGGIPIAVDALHWPIRKNHLRNTAQKLTDISGVNPNVLILLIPFIHSDLPASVAKVLNEDVRLRKLSEIFLVNPSWTSSGPACFVAHLPNTRTTVKHVSKTFIDLMMKLLFQ